MSKNEKPTAAFVLSLIAGVFILVNGVLLGFAGAFIAGLDMAGMMPWYGYDVPDPSVISTVLFILMAVGVVFGVIVMLGALMVYRNPSHKTAWGIIILVFSIISIVTGGGLFVGFILGIVGGALTLAWKPKMPTTAPTASTAT